MDANRIGALGICASGGYVPYAAQTEHRIKAVATVSAVDLGGLFRDSLGGNQSEDVIRGMLDKAGALRTEEAHGKAPHLERIVPESKEDTKGRPTLYQEGWEYG